MNIEFKNDMENNQLIVEIKWSRRKLAREKRLVMKTHQILQYVKDNYNPPTGYVLGECISGLRAADNDSIRRESLSCVFNLEEVKKPTPVKKNVVKKQTAAKKTSTRKK